VRIGRTSRAVPGGGGTRLETETQVRATVLRAKRVFEVYWLVIRSAAG
jgi:hypothetical protein